MSPDKHIQQSTPEQNEMMRQLLQKLPPLPWSEAERAEHIQTINSLRETLASQGRVSEQHVKQVQKLAAEVFLLKALLRELATFDEQDKPCWCSLAACAGGMRHGPVCRQARDAVGTETAPLAEIHRRAWGEGWGV